MGFWSNRRVLVTGGGGFLGRYVVRRLAQTGCQEVFVPRSRDYDLRDRRDVRRVYDEARPDVVIHLAAKVGGIAYNLERPAETLYDNLMMGLEVMEQARRYGVRKFVAVSSACAYPKDAPVPVREEDLWCGYPEASNGPYGIAKRVLILQAQTYRQQCGLDAISLIPSNLYGPGDDFDPASSHVIPALIRKCLEAKERGEGRIEVWGTGEATRDFLYVDDCAKAILLAAERYGGSEPVNVASGQEVTIRELAATIVRLTGFLGQIVWDGSKPGGQPRRALDTSRSEHEFGFRAGTALADGLQATVQWYLQERAAQTAAPGRK